MFLFHLLVRSLFRCTSHRIVCLRRKHFLFIHKRNFHSLIPLILRDAIATNQIDFWARLKKFNVRNVRTVHSHRHTNTQADVRRRRSKIEKSKCLTQTHTRTESESDNKKDQEMDVCVWVEHLRTECVFVCKCVQQHDTVHTESDVLTSVHRLYTHGPEDTMLIRNSIHIPFVRSFVRMSHTLRSTARSLARSLMTSVCLLVQPNGLYNEK